jgi:Transposase IS66 family
VRRRVFDLPERLIEVTEHRGLVYACACRGKPTRAAFPEGVTGPAQYGDRLAAGYLHAQQLIPEDRTAEALGDLTAADGLCAARGEWTRRRLRWSPSRSAPSSAPRVRCLDETGLRIGGKTQWLHTVATEILTLYRGCAKRGAMPEGLEGGVVVHDGFESYRNLDGAPRPPPMRSATLTIWANSKPSFRSTMSPGRQACAIVSAMPSRRSGRPAPREKRRSRPPRSKPSMPATGRPCTKVSPGIAACRGAKRRAGDNLLLRLHSSKTTSSGSRSTSTHPSPTISPSNLGRCFRVVQEARAFAANLIPALCVRPFSYLDLFCAQMIDSNP